MTRLRSCALAALAAAALFAPAIPSAEAQGWFGDRMFRERSDEDYSERRSRSYRRDAAARRSAREESRQRPLNFFERLFGGRDAQEEPAARPRGESPGAVEVRPKARRVVRRKSPAGSGPALAATPTMPGAAPVLPGQTLVPGAPLPGDPAAAAAANATPAAPAQPTTFVAVIGDSIADNLAFGLQEGFADTPELQVKRITKPNSGLVRADYFDFVAAIHKTLEAGPITYAVIDVGVNDRQPFLDARKETPPLSDEWKRRYAERIDALLAPFKEKKIPVYWVGLAASGSRRASADHTAINALAKDRVEEAGGTYVDVWEGFVDEDGNYAEFGPQLDGQTGRLRMDDGVHYSKAGARKLAHYVEQEIRKVFQPKPAPTPDAVVAAVSPDPGAAAPQPGPAAEKPRPISSPVMVLTASPRTANGALAAAGPATVPAREASDSAARVLVKGEAGQAETGRLDDHRWPGAEQPKLDRATPPAAAAPQPPAAPAPEAAALTDPKPIASQPTEPHAPGR